MKRGVATYKGDRYLAIEEANQKIRSLELSLAAVEKEISAEIATPTITKSQKASSTAENHYRTKYLDSALLVRQELGNNISDERLELEIYLRIASGTERAKVLGESDTSRLLKKEKPQMRFYICIFQKVECSALVPIIISTAFVSSSVSPAVIPTAGDFFHFSI